MLQVAVILVLLSLSHGAHLEHKAPLMGLESENLIPEEYIVLLTPDLAPLSVRLDAFEAYITKHGVLGVEVRGQTQMRDFAALLVRADDEGIELLRNYEEISIITTNIRVKVSSDSTWPSEVDGGQCLQQERETTPWGLTRTSFVDKPDYNTATYSYNSESGNGVTAYVLDTGIYTEHEDFEGRAVWGFTASDLKEEGDKDFDGHGTHVAGTIGGKQFGIAKSARLVAVKVLGGPDGSGGFGIIEGINWACNDFLTNRERDRKFKAVINMSLGNPYNITTDLIGYMAGQNCMDQGMVFVVAAGNENADTCDATPGRMSSAITVGATDIHDTIAWFSNWGVCVNILAPGFNITSAGIVDPSSTKLMSGTSMASPHVAGVVARYLSGLDEQPSPAQVKAWILDMAVRNKVNLTDVPARQSTPNFLLHIPCATVAESESESSGAEDRILTVTAITLFFVCVFLLAAIVAVAFWVWHKTRGGIPYLTR